ncbi:uncharacterized protein PAC_10105 [Phialocephala subalpina]|uniref:Uncharacterized protein n=1 Tax=Phialocephala subalpina TaxID=576137 RepID=A0A1L7X5A9_9HELO|nr:uncharacterized protein PAC_10105 [Phialocephala subalpina]
MSTSPQSAITIFFNVVPDNGQCPAPAEVFLWFISMIVISCTWSLLFGSLDFRKILRQLKIPLFADKSINFFISLTGSLIWNISMSVLTAYILTAEGLESSAPLRYLLMAWFARPLPGASTLLASLFDYNAFRANFQEIIFVESIYALPPIYLFGTIASQSIKFSSRAQYYLAQDKHYHFGFTLLRGGAAVDLLVWIILAYALITFAIVSMVEGISKLWVRKDDGITLILLALCVLRCLGGGLLWVGSVQLSPANFCPTKLMITKITLLWTFVPLVDVLWRGVWGVDHRKDDREERDD